MLSIIFGSPCTCTSEKRAVSKGKPPSRTDYGIVFHVIHYLLFTMYMWKKTSKPHRFWDCLPCCVIFGLPCKLYMWEEGILRELGIVFYVMCYLWLTIYMWKNFQAPQILGLSSFYVVYYLWLTVYMWRNLQATPSLGLSSILCIIFGLPCTREKRAFSKEKPPSRIRFWNCLLCCVLSLDYHVHVVSFQTTQSLGLSSMLCIFFGLPMHMWEEGILKG